MLQQLIPGRFVPPFFFPLSKSKFSFPVCRRCVRRQSARFKSQERAPTENLFEIEDSKLPATQPLDDPMHEDNSIQAGSSTANEEFSSSRNEARLSQRSSMGRPSRKAAEKVQSYKELPLKVKMRRTST